MGWGGLKLFFRNPEEAAQFWRTEEKHQKRWQEGGEKEGEQPQRLVIICIPSRSRRGGGGAAGGGAHLCTRVCLCGCRRAHVFEGLDVEGLMECWLPCSKQASAGNCSSTVRRLKKNGDAFCIQSRGLWLRALVHMVAFTRCSHRALWSSQAA